jgi:CSLREA domain-containing protein
VQKKNGAALAAPQGVPIAAADTHHDGSPSQTDSEAGLFSVALPFDTSADRIELWKGAPGATGSLLLYARNTSAAPTVTSMTSGGPILLRLRDAKSPATKPPPTRSVAAASRALAPTVYTVNLAADPGDGVCDAISCTLRDAILAANGNAGADTIIFSIGAGGTQTITPATPLPAITEAVTIDGTTQPGHGATPIIELDGSAAGANATGLYAAADNITIRGLVVNRFTYIGIWLQGANDLVVGNYIGTNVAGATAGGNQIGIFATIGPNTIGGTTTDSRNLISGN